MRTAIGGRTLELVLGDITESTTDAIVNAANSSLLGGGGVDGAIHRAGGPAILEACRKIRAESGPCPTGQAVITTAGRLHSSHVIHAVGPVWQGGTSGESLLLASAYRVSLELACANRLRSISFPSISTGAYGYPEPAAALVALQTVGTHLAGSATTLDLVRFVLFSAATLAHYERALATVAAEW